MNGAIQAGHAVAGAPAVSSGLPPRVRQVLTGLLELASDAFERELNGTLGDYEQQAFQCAEQARNNAVQTRWLETLRSVRRTRPDVVPTFLASLQTQLFAIRDNPNTQGTAQSAHLPGAPLTLLVGDEIEESSALAEVGSRIEMRNSLPIYLLGQRFGVLAGKPGFDSESLPIGPQALCRMLREASLCLEISGEHRILLYRVFEKNMLANYGRILAAISAYLVRENILPNLQYVPFRAPASPMATDNGKDASARRRDRDTAAPKETPRGEVPAEPSGTAEPTPPARARQNYSLQEKMSAAVGDHDPHGVPWWVPGTAIRSHQPVDDGAVGETDSAAAPAIAARRAGGAATADAPDFPGALDAAGAPEAAAPTTFDDFRNLLSRRRATLNRFGRKTAPSGPVKAVDMADVQAALGHLQAEPVAPVAKGGKPVNRSVANLKQDVLAQLRRGHTGDDAPALNEEDADTFDLMGMLFDELLKDVRPHSPAANLLTKLQVPLLRVALGDKNFFVDTEHPARQMMNAVAETGMYWLADEEADSPLMTKMQGVVDRTLRDFDGDLDVFQTLLQDLTGHLQTVARKAEVAERRHVEAERGKEKLAIARDHATRAVQEVVKDKSLPRFTSTLLEQAWTDVMALTALRQGEDSPLWKQQLETAQRLVELAAPGAIEPPDTDKLQADVTGALRQVGYHEEEAGAISKRLVAPNTAAPDETSSRTELMMRMKTAQRFGSDVKLPRATPEQLTPPVKARIEQIKQLPFGTWFEFVVNAQGDRARRRMSWFSPVSGNILFVNHRGQKINDASIDHVAIQMDRKQAFIAEDIRTSLIDKAWSSVVKALRNFGSTGTEGRA